MTGQDLIKNLADCRLDADVRVETADGYGVDVVDVDWKNRTIVLTVTEPVYTEDHAAKEFECDLEHVDGDQ